MIDFTAEKSITSQVYIEVIILGQIGLHSLLWSIPQRSHGQTSLCYHLVRTLRRKRAK